MTGSTSLTPDQQQRAREALRELRKGTKNQEALARSLHVKQQTISRVLQNGGVGVKLAKNIATLRGQTLEELIEGRAPPRTFAQLAGWAAASQEALDQRRASAAALLAVSRWPAVLRVERADVRLAIDLASLWTAWASREERDAVEREIAGSPLPPPHAPTPASGTVRVPTLSERRPKRPNEA